MFKKMPFVLIAEFLLIALIYPYLSMDLKSFLYGVSLSLKSGIVFFLPLIVFSLLFKSAVQMSRQASKWILGILVVICISNFTSTMLSYVVGKAVYGMDLSIALPSEGSSLQPLAAIYLPKWIGNDMAMFSGLLLGIFLGWIRPKGAQTIANFAEKAVSFFLKGFLFAIPFFIAGFVIKMVHDGMIKVILQSYSLIFAFVAASVFTYISLIYFAASKGSVRAFIQSVKNMLPAAFVGFGSMSSAAAMPLALIGAEKNGADSPAAKSFIPASVNIHLMGDCFAIPIFAFAILKSFGAAEPTLMSYLIFALYFVMAKFSVAAVPGGGILVMLPILEAYLGCFWQFRDI